MVWKNTRVLVTGGLGFIGSNLVHRLVQAGAAVTIMDNLLPGHGGNGFNIAGVEGCVHVNYADVTDRHAMNHLVRDKDVIFHLAGQVNHIASIEDPFSDLDINVKGTLTLLEACRQFNPRGKVVFTGTRGEYGRCARLPVDEDHPTNPMGIYAVTNLAAEQLLRIYHEVHGIRSVGLRITNTFGPRHQMRHNQYGVANWFVRLALHNQPITVMGDGSIVRDYLYIDDLVQALLDVATCDDAWGEVFNIGTGTPVTFRALAETVVRVAGGGDVTLVPFSVERQRIEPGHYYADVGKVARRVGWHATIGLEEGLQRTVAFYRAHGARYWGEEHATYSVGHGSGIDHWAVGGEGPARGVSAGEGAGG